ncbi:hypothetical protein [Nitratireductor sp. XY-223]|uniref:hypothetical protein n=1 Tax=Nitratireductor sp. XY-223 TaxID=2561926 RepID=UPI0010AABC1B|nr:hypothetical protein [Nitratireductor sp. XY-223]
MSSEHTSGAASNGVVYTISSLSDRPDLESQHGAVGSSAWPEFMRHDPVAIANWDKMISYFAADQVSVLIDGQIAAVINMVPLSVGPDFDNLPDRGVDWGVEKSVADHERGTRPNALMGVQVVVDKAFRGRNLSEAAAREMIRHAKGRELAFVLLPVRPNGKHAYPLIAMEDYIGWEDPEGRAFDGWLRVHQRLGGETVGICRESMIISGTIDEWEEWTGQRFPGSGQHIVPFALNPVEMDVEHNTGRYIEPNVWVVHRCGT